MNFVTIGDTLATRFAAAAITPPTSFSNVSLSTCDLPAAMPNLPAVFVFLDAGDFRTGNGTRQGAHDWKVRFYYNVIGDLERDLNALRQWAGVLVDQLKISVQLGGIVSRCTLDSYEIGILSYAGIQYSGIEMSVHVVTDEGWLAVA